MVSLEEIKKLSELARITLRPEEERELQKDVSAILEYVKVVEQSGVPKESSELGAVYNVMREDAEPHESGIFTEELLEAAPNREGNYVKVKRILAQ